MIGKMGDLTGKVALVTGGTRGLGLAIAQEFARAGAELIVASRKLDACKASAAEIEQRFGTRALGLACHVGDWRDCERLVNASYDAFGQVDILVNNAGISPAYEDVTSLSEELFDKILAVNLKGPFRLSALIGTRMKSNGAGAIVNIGSSAATHPLAKAIPYSAAKAGITVATKALAALLGPEVRVNCVEPGGIETDMTGSLPAEQIAEWCRDNAIKRFARPEEVAGAVLYLASEAASFTTGAVLRVDGGLPG